MSRSFAGFTPNPDDEKALEEFALAVEDHHREDVENAERRLMRQIGDDPRTLAAFREYEAALLRQDTDRLHAVFTLGLRGGAAGLRFPIRQH